jgi:hypothetical protein
VNKQQLEAIYQELLEESKQVDLYSVEDERIDAKLCLLEQLLESYEENLQ